MANNVVRTNDGSYGADMAGQVGPIMQGQAGTELLITLKDLEGNAVNLTSYTVTGKITQVNTNITATLTGATAVTANAASGEFSWTTHADDVAEAGDYELWFRFTRTSNPTYVSFPVILKVIDDPDASGTFTGNLAGVPTADAAWLAAANAVDATTGNFVSWDASDQLADSGSAAGDFATAGHDHSATYQPLDAGLTAIAALAVTDGNIIVGDGATWVAESGATARTSLGLGTGNSPQFTAVNVGSADTTLARVSAGVLSVEGVTILTVAGGTMTGGIAFSGTGHAGITLNNLTTAQREALTPAAGMLVWDTDEECLYVYDAVSAEWDAIIPTAYLKTYNNLSDINSAASARQNLGIVMPIIIACSDETTALTTGTAKVTFRMPFAMTLTAVRASVTTAPTGSTIIVDINEGGVSILSTKLSIDATEKTSTTAASAAVISDTDLADDAEITIDIDQVGSTIAGAGLKVTLLGYHE